MTYLWVDSSRNTHNVRASPSRIYFFNNFLHQSHRNYALFKYRTDTWISCEYFHGSLGEDRVFRERIENKIFHR